MEEYQYKRFTRSLIVDFMQLHHRVFGVPIDEEEVVAKFDTSKICQLEYIGYLAYDGKRPIGFYGVFPCWAQLGKDKFLCAQSGDTMTDPGYRGKGLFVKLARLTYDLAKEEGVLFIFGFPNSNSFPGFAGKLNWLFLGHIQSFKGRVFTLPLAILAKKYKILNSLYKRHCRFVFSKYKTNAAYFENSCTGSEHLTIIHDSSFFNYKQYFEKFIIKLGNYTMWVKIDGALFIGDIQGLNSHQVTSLSELKTLLASINKLAFFLGVNAIIINTSPNTPLFDFFKGALKSKETLPIGYLPLRENKDKAEIYSKLRFVGADFDTF